MKLKFNEAGILDNGTAITTAGVALDFSGKDDRSLFLITNGDSGAVTLTVLKGNGLQATEDYTLSVAAGKTVAVTLESGRFKNVSGVNKDKVVFKASKASSLTVNTIELP